MSGDISEDVLKDDLAVSLACMMATANRRARELGIETSQCLITIAQRPSGHECLWRVNYGPKNYISHRGGDLVIEMDPKDGSIRNVFRGQ